MNGEYGVRVKRGIHFRSDAGHFGLSTFDDSIITC